MPPHSLKEAFNPDLNWPCQLLGESLLLLTHDLQPHILLTLVVASDRPLFAPPQVFSGTAQVSVDATSLSVSCHF